MLKLYNKEHEVLSALTNLKDYKIEYVLSGEDLLEFSLSRYDENIPLIQEECYIRTEYNEYVIKAIESSDNFKRFTCNINIESLVGKVIKNFDTKNNNINDTIRLTIAGTGWTLADNNISKKRTVSLKNTNALEVLRKVRETFRVDFRFDAINKIIYVYEKLGSDKGVYFTDELNLISLDVPSDSYDYATRLYAKGKDGLTFADINNGKDYIENFQYSNKIIEKIWEDNRYTNKQNLKEDAEAKLEELSKPRRNYNVQVYDLAKNNSEFSFLDFSIGDTVTIISNLEKFKDKQRIVKYIEYPDDPSQNTCELGNTTLTFEELQKANEAKNQVVENITSDNGTVDGSKVDSITTDQITDFEAEVAKVTDLTVVNAEITNLKAQNVTITGKLTAIEGEFGTLKVNVGVIDKLTVTHSAEIKDLKANSATINDLKVINAEISNLQVGVGKIGILEADVGKINTLLAGNLTGGNIQAGGITSDKLTIANGFITNAMIANLDVSKINAGDISTNKFKIKSDNGGIEIVGATQQFKDKNNRVRIQMGQDTKGNFNFIIRGEDGTTTLIDHTGIKEKAIADDLIKETMIAQDAIGEKQINYSSFITGFNKDTNTNTIKSTKIMLNNQNQTLDVAFSQLKTQADGTKTLTESHSTTIGVMQGQISTAINNTQIVKDGQTILLKDDYNRTVQTVNSMNSTIGSHTTQLSGLNSTISTQTSDISQLKNQIKLKVEQTDINNAINNMEIGGRNLLLNSYKEVTNNDYVIYSYTPTELFEINEEYTISVCITPAEKVTHIDPYVSGGGMQLVALKTNGTKKQVITGTFTFTGYHKDRVPTSTTHQYARVAVYRFPNNGTVTSNTTIHWIKIEKGNKATDWTPAPEDTQGQLDAHTAQITTTNNKVASIETNLSSITSRVSSVEQTQVSTNGKVTSLETWKKDAEKKITSDAIISTVTSSQTYKDALTGKVSTNQIISSINQTAEAVKINASKIDLTGDLTLQGTFKCWKDANNKNGSYLYSQGAMVRGYTSSSASKPTFASGLWRGVSYDPFTQDVGYVSVGLTNAVDTDENGCLWMSINPESNGGGTRLTYSRLSGGYQTSSVNFNRDGSMNFKCFNNYSGATPFYFNKGMTIDGDLFATRAYLGGELGTRYIFPRISKTYDIGSRNYSYNTGYMVNIQSDNAQLGLYAGNNQYGGLILDQGGYFFPSKSEGISFGKASNKIFTIHLLNPPSVSSDKILKTDIHYLDEPYNPTVLKNRVNVNMNITTKDMYEFIRDDLRLASYRYKSNIEKDTSVNYGFIAQDALYTKVGSEIVQLADKYNLNSELSYNQGNYISVIAGALQQEIRKRDKEIKELRLEIEKLKSQKELEVA